MHLFWKWIQSLAMSLLNSIKNPPYKFLIFLPVAIGLTLKEKFKGEFTPDNPIHHLYYQHKMHLYPRMKKQLYFRVDIEVCSNFIILTKNPTSSSFLCNKVMTFKMSLGNSDFTELHIELMKYFHRASSLIHLT